HAAPARRAGPAAALPAQAPRARGPHPEERARRLPQPDAGDPLAPQAEARLNLRSTKAISGQNSSSSARPVSEPTRPLEKNTAMSPCDTSIAWRKDASARS